MVIIWGSSFLLAVFLFFAVALGYQAYLAVHGIALALSILVMLVQTVVAVVCLVNKIKAHKQNPKATTAGHIIMSFIAAFVCLAAAYLFAKDLPSYGTGFMDMVCFIVGTVFCGGMWFFTLGGFVTAVSGDGFGYGHFFLELIPFAILFVLCVL
ncbi:MAG: hypothetical protein ACLTCK_11340 [Oscillospiraceae bacterium]